MTTSQSTAAAVTSSTSAAGAAASNEFNPVAAAVCHLASLANCYATSNAQISPISSATQHANFLGQSNHTTPQNNSSFYNTSQSR